MRRALSLFGRRLGLRQTLIGTGVLAVLSVVAIMIVGSRDSVDYDVYIGAVREHYNNVVTYVGEYIGAATSSAGNSGEVYWEEPFYDEETVSRLVETLNTPLFPESDVNKTSTQQCFKENLQLYRDTLKEKIDEPQVAGLVRASSAAGGGSDNPVAATILSLVRNEDLEEMIASVMEVERAFNSKFAYPYTFLNDGEFTQEFQDAIRAALPAGRKVQFGTIAAEDWSVPDTIDLERFKASMQHLEDEGVAYATRESYHNMCRYFSRGFYHHPLLREYKYTWRLEPGVKFFCEVDYDVFRFMADQGKVYGYVLNLYDNPQSVESLWRDTREWLEDHTQYLSEGGAFDWVRENMQKPENFATTGGYSTCHFWTNFEIASLDWLRSEPYEAYMDFLESMGGFYYERWGDAPVRSLALALFADRSQIHWFRDIGYAHFPYSNCPNSDRCDKRCSPAEFVPWDNLEVENCQATWIKYAMTQEERDLYYKKEQEQE